MNNSLNVIKILYKTIFKSIEMGEIMLHLASSAIRVDKQIKCSVSFRDEINIPIVLVFKMLSLLHTA